MQTLFDDTLASAAQLMADDALDPQTLAGGCHMTLEWVSARVQAGVLEPVSGDSTAT